MNRLYQIIAVALCLNILNITTTLADSKDTAQMFKSYWLHYLIGRLCNWPVKKPFETFLWGAVIADNRAAYQSGIDGARAQNQQWIDVFQSDYCNQMRKLFESTPDGD